LSSELKNSYSGKFTPDGTRIGFLSSDTNINPIQKVYVIDKDSKNIKYLLELPVHHSGHFSLSNTDVIYEKGTGDRSQIFKVDFQTSIEINLSNNSYHNYEPIYSADRLKIAFARYYKNTRSLCIMNADGSDQTEIYKFIGLSDLGLHNLLFTPDGTRIVFYFQGEIYRINVDGTNLKKLTESGGQIDIRNLSMSPIGDKIVYNEWEISTHISHTFIQNIYGHQKLELFELSEPTWNYIFTPAGRDVFFSTSENLYIVDVGGNIIRQLSRNEHVTDIYDYK